MITKIDGIGIDIVDLNDIKEKLSEAFIKRILSKEELTYYRTITHEDRKLAFLAGRFAAKEAYTKAYKHFETPLNFSEVSILHDADNAPYIVSKHRPNDCLEISISHSKTYAIAMVMLEKKA